MAGQSLSLTGSWIQQTAIGWLLYRLTHSTAWLGWLGFCAQIPILLFATLTGVIADRFDRRRLLFFTQSLALGQALILALLAWSNRVTPLNLVLLTLFLGAVSAIDLPARQALVPMLLNGKDDLSNAVSLNSTLVNATSLWGPAIAGILVARVGEDLCFLLNGLSYLALVAALLMIRFPPRAELGPPPDFWSHWKEGVAYAFVHPAIRQVLGLLAIASLVMMPAPTLMPAVAQAFYGGPRLMGALLAASAFGALSGGFTMASARFNDPDHHRRIMAWAVTALAFVMLAISFTRALWLLIGLHVVGGFGFTLVIIASNTWLQLSVPDSKRGRIMSFLSIAFLGMAPLGCLLGGFLCDRFGLFPTIRFGGCLCFIAVLIAGLGSRTELQTNLLT